VQSEGESISNEKWKTQGLRALTWICSEVDSRFE
jgi:hypothetical protein